jgi:hypothetical protein
MDPNQHNEATLDMLPPTTSIPCSPTRRNVGKYRGKPPCRNQKMKHHIQKAEANRTWWPINASQVQLCKPRLRTTGGLHELSRRPKVHIKTHLLSATCFVQRATLATSHREHSAMFSRASRINHELPVRLSRQLASKPVVCVQGCRRGWCRPVFPVSQGHQ